MTGRDSLRDLQRDVEALESGLGDLPPAGPITILSTLRNGGVVEAVDRERRLLLVDGEPHRATDDVVDRIDWDQRVIEG